MDETTQTTFPVETFDTESSIPATTEMEEFAPPSTAETVIQDFPEYVYSEDFSENAIIETIPITTEPVYIDVIESVGTDIVHASLFGDFLICGTLVGLALFRRIYGT